MNAVIKAIKKRRSVRSYESKPIPRDIINMIIEAGNEAPSAMNSQPWRFVVVEDKKVKENLLGAALPNAKKILEMVKDVEPERYEMIMKRYVELTDPIYYSATAIIFVIGSGRYADHSCPLACENMMLAAYSCQKEQGVEIIIDPELHAGRPVRGDAAFVRKLQIPRPALGRNSVAPMSGMAPNSVPAARNTMIARLSQLNCNVFVPVLVKRIKPHTELKPFRQIVPIVNHYFF